MSEPIAGGIGPVILFLPRSLRRRRSVAHRAGRRGTRGDSQDLQRREQTDLGRDRAVDLVGAEAPATPRRGRAPRRASGTRGNSQVRQRREQADPGRDRAGDLVFVEDPTTPKVGHARRRASGDAGELAAPSSWRDQSQGI